MRKTIALAGCLLAGCGSGQTLLDVGSVEEGGLMLSGGDGASSGSLRVAITPSAPSVCEGQCVELAAQASGGIAPYAYAWSLAAASDAGTVRVCPSSTTTYQVKATDSSGQSGESFANARSGSASVTVTVADDCDAGVQDGAAPMPPGDADAGSIGCGGPDSVCWTTWVGSSPGPPGSANGTIAIPQGSIVVTYAGEVHQPILPAAPGTNMFTPASTYTCATVVDPPNATIVLQAGGTQVVDTLTFSQPVTNPVFAIMSLGNSTYGIDCTYEFGAYGESFTILSDGMGYMAGPGTLSDVDGGLVGNDGDGLVQLIGTFTTIQWTDPVSELTGEHGFTVGIPAQ